MVLVKNHDKVKSKKLNSAIGFIHVPKIHGSKFQLSRTKSLTLEDKSIRKQSKKIVKIREKKVKKVKISNYSRFDLSVVQKPTNKNPPNEEPKQSKQIKMSGYQIPKSNDSSSSNRKGRKYNGKNRRSRCLSGSKTLLKKLGSKSRSISWISGSKNSKKQQARI